MSKHHQTKTALSRNRDKISALAKEAQALMDATVDVAEEKVGEARNRLSARLDGIREGLVERAKSTDRAVRENPYRAIVVALGVGAILGFASGRGSARNGD